MFLNWFGAPCALGRAGNKESVVLLCSLASKNESVSDSKGFFLLS